MEALPEIEAGDRRAALGWIRRSRLPPPVQRALSRFVRRFGSAQFYRELPAHHDRVEALLGRRLPRWYRRIRAAMAFVVLGERQAVHLGAGPKGWYRFDLCGMASDLPADRPRNPVIPLARAQAGGDALGLRPSGRGVWRKGRTRRMSLAYADYLAMLEDVTCVALADGRALWKSERKADWYARGDQALDAGEAAAAIEALSQAVRLNPDHRDAWFRLGVARKQAGQLADAAAAFERSAACPGRDYRNLWWNWGVALIELDRHAEALPALEKAVSLGPETSTLHYRRATALWKLDRYEEALAAIDRAIALTPDKAPHLDWELRGQILDKLGRKEEAIAAWQRTAALDPGYRNGWFRLGLAYKEAKRLPEALEALQRAAGGRGADFRNIWWNMGDVLMDLQRPAEALPAWDRAIALGPADPALHYWRGVALHGLERHEEALAALDRGLAMSPAKPRHYLYWRGETLAKLGRADEAIAAWLQAASQEPGQGYPWNKAGLCEYNRGNYAAAVARYSEGLAHCPGYAGLWFNRACSRAMLGEKAGSLADLAESIRIEPRYAADAREDADFTSLWADPDFLALTASAG